MNALKIAEIVHEVNRIYCSSIGDNSQPSWEDAPEWQKQSMINGVNYKLANLSATPQEMHENWLKVKTEDGWTYGEVKDVEKKTHPCFLPYAELPADQKVKDSFSTFLITILAREIESSSFDTAGNKLVGRKFNPGKLDEVDTCKGLYAKAIDQLDTLQAGSKTHETLIQTAITNAITAQMWAVKAITFGL